MPRTRPEIYFLLAKGMRAKDLIKRNIPVTTAYAYSARYKRTVKKDVETLMNTPPCSEEELKKILKAHYSKYGLNKKKNEE